MKRIMIQGPALSRSGYGEMARFAVSSLRDREDVELYLINTQWGGNGNITEQSEEIQYINSLIKKTTQVLQQNNNTISIDISIQVTIPNEWKKLAPINIGYTAGIETNLISPAWLEPSNQMDKIIVISEHAKSGFINTLFGNQQGQQFKVTKPIDVVHFPIKENKSNKELDLNLKYDFNFLSVCQWGPRKNLEQTIIGFIEEFRNEEIGLVLKVNGVNDSIIDRFNCEERIQNILSNFKDRKCSIHLVHGTLTEEEINSIYTNTKIKAIISTSHGEGYGIPLFEATANELPVIATDWSGHLDFLTMPDEQGKDKKMFARVECEIKPIAKEHVWQGVLEEGTSWAYPSMTAYKNKLREVIKDYPRFKSWAKKLAAHNKQKFTKEKVNDSFVKSVLGEESLEVSIGELPKISVITSVFNGDEHIEGFLEDITNQTIFKEKCELILVNANSPGNEEEVINKYIEKYPNNIVYKKLEIDPGIYACWNIAAKLATGEYLTNANLDDRKSPQFLEILAKKLVKSKEVDVVYADNLLTNVPNETWSKNTAKSKYPSEEFSLESMLRGNPPHCMPMWRKSLHKKFGYFEEKYRSAGDWEFWLRCAFDGVKMIKINKPLGLYYFNPKGISTNTKNSSWKRQEEKEIFKKYLGISQGRQN
jgi:hypothetical protein